jgi:hypothetical protein
MAGEFLFAVVAQLVEQRFRKAQVVGSSPINGSIWKTPGNSTPANFPCIRGDTAHTGFVCFLDGLN